MPCPDPIPGPCEGIVCDPMAFDQCPDLTYPVHHPEDCCPMPCPDPVPGPCEGIVCDPMAFDQCPDLTYPVHHPGDCCPMPCPDPGLHSFERKETKRQKIDERSSELLESLLGAHRRQEDALKGPKAVRQQASPSLKVLDAHRRADTEPGMWRPEPGMPGGPDLG